MGDTKLYELSDTMTDLRVKLDEIRCFADLMLHAYADPAPMKMEVGEVERLQYNLYTLFDLIANVLDKAKATEAMADEFFEASKEPA